MMVQRQWKQKKGAGTVTATNCSLTVMQSSFSVKFSEEGREGEHEHSGPFSEFHYILLVAR